MSVSESVWLSVSVLVWLLVVCLLVCVFGAVVVVVAAVVVVVVVVVVAANLEVHGAYCSASGKHLCWGEIEKHAIVGPPCFQTILNLLVSLAAGGGED